MLLSYEFGDASRPKGHALLYFRGWTDSSEVYATYVIVPPISVDISKYIPPMFAAQFQQVPSRGITVFPYPPIPEKVEGVGWLERLAKARDDDLISCGTVDASSPERLLTSTAEAAHQYYEGYSSYLEGYSPEPAVEAEREPERIGSSDVSDLLYGLMGERERLAELAKLSGKLRYAVASSDRTLVEETLEELDRLGRFLPEKYRVKETLAAAQFPGPQGDALTQLYLDRAFKLADEDYEIVMELDNRIKAMQQG